MDAPMLTRTCARCQEEKTIRGVWYVLQAERGERPAFICETCYTGRVLVPA